MKKLLILSAFVFIVLPGLSQINNEIVIGAVDSVKSTVLNETRKFWIYVPRKFDPNSIYSSGERFPVVYLLDGNDHFHSVTGLIHNLGSSNGNSVVPDMIVVAIPNTDRTRDLTPTHSMLMPDGKEAEFLRSSGGGENFTKFLESELIPYVEAHYPTAPHRMLIGHSFGGLFAINTVVHHPELFNTYIAIDPSMWWDHGKLLNQSATAFKSEKLKGRGLFVGIANTMPAGTDFKKVEKDTSTNTAHIRSILSLAKMGKGLPAGGLRFNSKYYPDDTHGSCVLATEYDGFRFLYDFYKAPQDDPAKITPDMFTSKYKSLSDRMGYKILPSEATVNNFGYMFLGRKDYEKAYAFFKMNIDNYPMSFNVFDSMGDYYVAKDEKAKAIESFEKALALKDFPETKRKLEELKGH